MLHIKCRLKSELLSNHQQNKYQSFEFYRLLLLQKPAWLLVPVYVRPRARCRAVVLHLERKVTLSKTDSTRPLVVHNGTVDSRMASRLSSAHNSARPRSRSLPVQNNVRHPAVPHNNRAFNNHIITQVCCLRVY